MASTLRPQDAFDVARHFIKDMTLEKVSPRVLDDVNKYMWMAAPWRWTVGSMPLATLLNATQDYTIVLPTDFLYLLNAYTTDGTATRELRVEPALPSAVTLNGQPSRVAIVGSAYRVSPVPGAQPTVAPKIVSLYKKMAPTITPANMATAGVQVFDDEWFWVFQEGVLWKSYLYAEDSRAGNVEAGPKGQITYTGQRGVFEAALQFMMANEKLPEIKPQESR